MLFAITVTYTRPPETIGAHLDMHKAWLLEHARAGNILVAGPLQHDSGGFILAHGEGLDDIRKMLAGDPFDIHRLVTFDIRSFEAALRADNFPATWAAGARSARG